MRVVIQKLLLVLALSCWSILATALPQIEHWQTGNGARVYFVAAHELPMVDVQVVFDAGSARDAQPGVANLTAGLLTEGAGKLEADAIAETFDALGARIGSSAGRDYASVTLRSLTAPTLLQPALDTLSLILRAPTFPAAAFERERKRVLIGLRAQEQNPAALAERAFYRALYGNHPYAHPPLGTAQSVTALRRDDVLSHYRRYYVARNAIVVIVGALQRTAAEQVAETLVGQLPPGNAPAPLPAVAEVSGETVRITHPSSQTHILLGQPVLRRGDPDYFALYVGNHILGGSGLVSRLSEEVREKRGLAYSAYSYFLPMREAGPFQLGVQTKNESATEALEVMRATLERYRSEGPTAAELLAAKKNITGGFPLNIDSNSDIAGYLAMIAFYGLPLDYLDRFIGEVNAVTAAQIRDAFQRRVDPARLVTVTVGNGT
ncbi:MAG: pitrilysin family protein [Thiohalomonadaceae bacterium]